MTSIAIFLEPHKDLKNSMMRWKEKVEKVLPGQPYCSHPPHCTLIHTNVRSEDSVDQRICEMHDSFSGFQIKVSGTDVFLDDTATGGHTIYFKIIPNLKLLDFQLRIAEAVSTEAQPTKAPEFVKNNLTLKNSYEKYGFPFIGSHWIPHFSIASLRVQPTHPLITDFLSLKREYEFELSQFSMWRIESEQHTLIKEYKFTL